MRIVCALPFVVKGVLIAMILGFAAGFYFGLGVAPVSVGTPGPAIDQNMLSPQLPAQDPKPGLSPPLLPVSQEARISP